jgi:hypothetical protein
MRKGLKEWNFENPSRIRKQSGHTIGDDLCGPIPRDIKAPGLEVSDFLVFHLSFLSCWGFPFVTCPLIPFRWVSISRTAVAIGTTLDSENRNVSAVGKGNMCLANFPPVTLISFLYFFVYLLFFYPPQHICKCNNFTRRAAHSILGENVIAK